MTPVQFTYVMVLNTKVLILYVCIYIFTSSAHKKWLISFRFTQTSSLAFASKHVNISNEFLCCMKTRWNIQGTTSEQAFYTVLSELALLACLDRVSKTYRISAYAK